MRIVVMTEEEYKKALRMQKILTGLFKMEENENIKDTLKLFMNTTIEKAYERPDESIKAANEAEMDTDDPALIIPYLVHGAVSRKKCAIMYTDSKGNTSKRVIEPFSWRNNQVVAWCHERGAWRQFKPTNINRVAILNEDFDREDDVEIVPEDAKRSLQ